MPTIALGSQHPLYWVLTSLLGESHRSIARAVDVKPHTVASWAHGYTPKPTVIPKLQRRITTLMSGDYNNAAARELQSDTHRDWYRLTFKLINEYLEDADTSRNTSRSSELQRLIVANIPEKGARRSWVIGQLQRSYSAYSIRRAAKLIRVREERDPEDPSFVMWFPPPTPSTERKPVKVTPVYAKPRSKRAEQLQTLISIYLGRRHDRGQEKVKASLLWAHVHARGHSRPAFYDAVRDMCLLKETTGFGPTRVTYYALPHLKESEE